MIEHSMAKKKRNLANHLRNNITLPEVLLWNQLKSCQTGFYFNRQFCWAPIADFYCREIRLGVEVDGLVHDLKKRTDAECDEWMQANNITILRFSAKSVLKNPYVVGLRVREYLEEFNNSAHVDRGTSF